MRFGCQHYCELKLHFLCDCLTKVFMADVVSAVAVAEIVDRVAADAPRASTSSTVT